MRDAELIWCKFVRKGLQSYQHLEDDKIIEIEGYSCKEGLSYAEQEITRLMRILTDGKNRWGGQPRCRYYRERDSSEPFGARRWVWRTKNEIQDSLCLVVTVGA